MKRLAIITTHPIQYYAPLFKLLHQRGTISIKVFYTLGKTDHVKHDHGFNKAIAWDIPLLEGYEYEWAENVAEYPGTHHFKGIITPRLPEMVNSWHPDAVLIFGWANKGHLETLKYFKGRLPVYFRGDSTLLDEKAGIRSILKYIFLRWVYRHVDKVFYVGTNNRAYYKRYGLKEQQLIFAPHAIDNERFAADRSVEAATLREETGVSSDEILILFAGKFEDKKNPLLLLNVFLEMRIEKCHLLFVGDGKLETELRSLARDNRRVHFMPFQNQSFIPVVYQACDLFCLPSKGPGETWGLAVNEAMACSKAILVSNRVGSAPDLVKEWENGATFMSGNGADLQEKLTRLTKDRETLKNLGKRSAEMIKEWNFLHIAEAIENSVNR